MRQRLKSIKVVLLLVGVIFDLLISFLKIATFIIAWENPELELALISGAALLCDLGLGPAPLWVSGSRWRLDSFLRAIGSECEPAVRCKLREEGSSEGLDQVN